MKAQEVENSLFPLSGLRVTENGSAEHGKELIPSCPGALLSDSQTLTKLQLLEQQATEPCERVGILVELAEYRLEAGRIEQAIELLERAIKCHSQAARPVLLLGRAWEAEGNYDKALETYLEAIQRGVASAEVEAALFRPEFLLSTYPRAVTELEIVAVRKKSGLLWRRLARACEVNADHTQALTFLAEALRQDPNDVAALSMLARTAEKRRQMDEAAMWHRRILEINPGLPVSNLFLARQYSARGEYAEALPYLARLRLNERHNRTYRLLWLLAYIHVSGVNGLEDQIEEIRTWQDLSSEEQALVHELFLLAGERSLEEGRTRAEQYILQALRLAPSPSGSSLLAEIEQRKSARAVHKHVLKTLATEDETADEFSPTTSNISPAAEVNSSSEEEWQKQPAWMRRVLPRVALRSGGAPSSAEKNQRSKGLSLKLR